ncbi:MAG: isoprenylcysteine carboxylmethyltransferase family protein [Planctomycetota bacterium]
MPAEARTTSLPGRTPVQMLPPVYLFLAMAAMTALDQAWPVRQLFPMPGKMLGWVPILVGSGLCLAAASRFRRAATTIRPFRESAALVTTGPFRFSRNPMYLGLVLVLVGYAVIAGSATPWVVLPFFVAVIRRRFVAVEEAMLTDRFGEDYERYRRRVRRWL